MAAWSVVQTAALMEWQWVDSTVERMVAPSVVLLVVLLAELRVAMMVD
jgi:hypothetical protein